MKVAKYPNRGRGYAIKYSIITCGVIVEAPETVNKLLWSKKQHIKWIGIIVYLLFFINDHIKNLSCYYCIKHWSAQKDILPY